MDGMEIDPQVLINTQANIIAQNAIRMTQLEAAVQQLAQENAELSTRLAVYDDVDSTKAEEG